MSAMFNRGVGRRTGWILLGLMLAWSVAQASLMQVPNGAPVVGAANLVYLAGVAVSLLAHDLLQTLVGRLFGASARNAETGAEQGRGAAAELAMAAAGPVVSLVLSVVLVMLARVAYVAGLADPLIRALAAVASFNIVLALANLIPALPLDGGRLLRGIVWRVGKDPVRAGRIAGVVSEVIALLILAVGVTTAFVGAVADALMWLLFGVLMLSVARGEHDAAAAAIARKPGPAERPAGFAGAAEPAPGDRPLTP